MPARTTAMPRTAKRVRAPVALAGNGGAPEGNGAGNGEAAGASIRSDAPAEPARALGQATRAWIETHAKPAQFLARIMGGEEIGGETATLDQRFKAAVLLLDKTLPDLKAIETANPEQPVQLVFQTRVASEL